MDEPGWTARRRAKQEELAYAHPLRGPDGKFKPIETLQPLNAPYDLASPTSDEAVNLPPPLPPKDHDEWFSRGPQSPSVASRPPTLPLVPSHQIPAISSNLSPVERTQRSAAPPRMKPYLQCMCGPLLKYETVDHNSIYHGACLLVTADGGSRYEPLPSMFLEWDPAAGPPNSSSTFNGVNGRTSSENGQLTGTLGPHPSDPHSVFNAGLYENGEEKKESSSSRKLYVTGDELWVYSGAGGTFTFWRFKYQIPLTESEMKVSYSVNAGQKLSFFVPGKHQNMRWAAHSCNGFSAGVNEDEFRGPGFESGYDPVWIDLLQRHREQPFHVMVGGGDQLYCDKMMREPEMQSWVNIKAPQERLDFELTQDIAMAIDRFYFSHYCNAFRHGAFARANSTIPMVNMLDDHDLIDGFGSYPEDLQNSAMFKQIGARGYFYFLLFQCFTNDEKDGTNAQSATSTLPSLIVGGLGPYIPYPSHSFLTYLGPKVWMVLIDCRAERKKNQVCSEIEYTRIFDRLLTLPGTVEHLVVQLGIPIAYPRMNFLEHALESKFNPITAISKTGTLAKNFVNKFNADAELLDDLNDHWTATTHKKERNWLVEQLQKLALQRKLRISFLSGDVHCTAVGLFKTHTKGKGKEVPPEQDHRYMMNIVSSAIVNTPPPGGVLTMVSLLANKKHRTMHAVQTDETMIAAFPRETTGGSPKSKYVMGKRNYCSVHHDESSGELVFDIRVEIVKGMGETTSYPVHAPPPLFDKKTDKW